MIKRFEDFKLNEMKGYPFVSTLIIFDGDNMINNAFYFDNSKDAKDAFVDLSKCAELIGDLSYIKSSDNEVIGFKCQNLRESETRIPVLKFLRKPNTNSDSFSVVIYECESDEAWSRYIRDLKMRCEQSDMYKEKI
jgi:hypothetical protein